MKVAVIDLGTNTFHLLIAEVGSRSFKFLQSERRAVQIGKKGINNGEITQEAWERAIKTLKEYRDIIESNHIRKVFAKTTSAIRSAMNGEELITAIKQETGIDVKIISGKKEAELILLGVKKALDLGADKSLIVDIGGGSIEFIIADRTQTYWLQSFEIGGQRLVEKFCQSDPISTNEIGLLINHFQENLGELKRTCLTHNPRVLVGCSGTFDTLGAICSMSDEPGYVSNEKGSWIEIESFNKIYGQIIQKTRAERLAIPGMIKMRVDMIVVTVILIKYLADTFNIEKLRISAYALKEGIFFDSFNQMRFVPSPQ